MEQLYFEFAKDWGKKQMGKWVETKKYGLKTIDFMPLS